MIVMQLRCQEGRAIAGPPWKEGIWRQLASAETATAKDIGIRDSQSARPARNEGGSDDNRTFQGPGYDIPSR